MKTTGAFPDTSKDYNGADIIKQQQQQQVVQRQHEPTGLPLVNAEVEDNMMGDNVVVESIATSGTSPGVNESVEVEVSTVNELMASCDETQGNAAFGPVSVSGTSDSSEDEDLFDLLVDTLDGEFDPELMI